MRIVVLDGYCENPGDLSWRELESLGDLTVYDRTSSDLIIERMKECDAVIVNKTPISRETICACPRLRYIGVLATGYNVVDTVAAKERNIPVCNAPGYATDAVAQHMFSLLLSLTNHTASYADAVARGEWSKSPDFALIQKPITELSGLVMGFLGLGQIGKRAAAIAAALGMHVIAHHVSDPPPFVESVSVDELLAKSDVLSLCCPLCEETKDFISDQNLAKMKDGVIILNIARGGLVDEYALANALKSGKVGAFGADVLAIEPPVFSPLIGLENTLITPHVAWASRAARERLMRITCDNLAAFMGGQPQNVVNL